MLIPLQEIRGELNLILTQRPMHLRAHPGQISFPGGKIEPSDPSAIMAALREAEEEIGLCRENVDVIGTFPAHNTFTGFEITPVVGIIKQDFTLRLDPGEVADCFTVPLSFLSNQAIGIVTHSYAKAVITAYTLSRINSVLSGERQRRSSITSVGM